MGRPRRVVQPVEIQVKLLCFPGLDDDLIAFFATVPPRRKATAVKAAMRSGQLVIGTQIIDVDDDDIDAALDGMVF